MAKSRTRTKIVMEIGSARASTTPARLIIINKLIMRWTLATAYPAEMLGAPRQNLRGIVETTHSIILPSDKAKLFQMSIFFSCTDLFALAILLIKSRGVSGTYALTPLKSWK